MPDDPTVAPYRKLTKDGRLAVGELVGKTISLAGRSLAYLSPACHRKGRAASMSAPAAVGPVRLCCGQRHDGALCPDGLVMCCVCFDRVPVDRLVEVPGGHEDVCLDCARPAYRYVLMPIRSAG